MKNPWSPLEARAPRQKARIRTSLQWKLRRQRRDSHCDRPLMISCLFCWQVSQEAYVNFGHPTDDGSSTSAWFILLNFHALSLPFHPNIRWRLLAVTAKGCQMRRRMVPQTELLWRADTHLVGRCLKQYSVLALVAIVHLHIYNGVDASFYL